MKNRKGKKTVEAADREDRKAQRSPPSEDVTGETAPQQRVFTHTRGNYRAVLCLLLVIRLTSAMTNLVHDCDEVFNFFEPLHFLVHGFGLQTWEHSAEFSLRSYLYLGVHWLVVKPLALIVGSRAYQFLVFHGFRVILAIVSAFVEAELYRAVVAFGMSAAASYLIIFLALATGLFCAPTTFLPSTTAMYCMTYCAAHVLHAHSAPTQQDKVRAVGKVIGGACVATLLAWPVCGIAFLPYALWVLVAISPRISFGMLFTWAGLILVPSFFIDKAFYGRPTLALYNFVRYNVFGGGDSHLYGVEGFEYYFVSGLLNFNGIWLLALTFPFLALTELALQMAQGPPSGLHAVDGPREPSGWSYYASKLVHVIVVLSPIYVWTGTLTLLPHKEERFLYVVYPLICLAGGVTLQMLEAFLRGIARVPASAVNRLVTAGLTLVTIVSASRTLGLLAHYGAPMRVWAALPADPGPLVALPSPNFAPTTSIVCVGGEWHRFPSSFFLPSDRYRVGFLKTSFDGMMPTYFSEKDWPWGGTTSAPAHLNDRNREHPRQYVGGIEQCSYVVQLEPGEEFVQPTRLQWRLLKSVSFLNASASPVLSRALLLPGTLGADSNVWSKMRLYKRVAI